MRPTRPTRRPPSSFRLPPARLAAAFVLLLAGCANPEAAGPRPPEATVRIRNLSDLEWTVALEPSEPRSAPFALPAWRIPPRGERVVSVPAGAYRLRRSFGDALAPDACAEGETIRLLPGRGYTWLLATLLSEPETSPP